jgi:phosphohistidine phosphatase
MRLTGYVPDHVLCSTAVRTRETWQLAESELDAQPAVRFEPEVYGASASTLLDLIRQLPPAARTVTVVGHDPAMPEAALALTADQQAPPAAVERLREKFPTAAIAVLAFSGPWSALRPGSARLVAFVTPRDMERR